MSEHILKFWFRFVENIITQITPNLIYNYIYNCGVFESWIQINIAPILFLFKCLDSSTFAWLNFFFNLFGQLLWVLEHFLKKGNFYFFIFFKKSCLSFKKDSPTATSVLCVCVYIYCCTYSCSMRQFSWATLLVNKISFLFLGFLILWFWFW